MSPGGAFLCCKQFNEKSGCFAKRIVSIKGVTLIVVFPTGDQYALFCHHRADKMHFSTLINWM